MDRQYKSMTEQELARELASSGFVTVGKENCKRKGVRHAKAGRMLSPAKVMRTIQYFGVPTDSYIIS